MINKLKTINWKLFTTTVLKVIAVLAVGSIAYSLFQAISNGNGYAIQTAAFHGGLGLFCAYFTIRFINRHLSWGVFAASFAVLNAVLA